MRPLPGGDVLPPARPRSRKSSVADPTGSASGPSSHVPTTFFMRSEEEMEQSLAASMSSSTIRKHRESTFGVQSLADTLETAFGHEGRESENKNVHASGGAVTVMKDSPRRSSTSSSRSLRGDSESCKASPKRIHKSQTSDHTISIPLTPLNGVSQSPVPASAIPSTPRSVSLQSFKLSDEEPSPDDAASQAIVSSGEDEEDTTQIQASSFPQLVMPSIQMPSRRPFTARGKAMGKLKVLIAGQSGIGKTSLIRSIVQLCEDIVHVDPLSPSASQALANPPPPKSRARKKTTQTTGTTSITEIHASTKPYPVWWTDIEGSRTLRRRKSGTDTVLDRNLCFVDTPGFRSNASNLGDTGPLVDYVESLLYQTASVTAMEDNDLVGLVSGNGGILVDAIFYLLPPGHDISGDIERMQHLSALTNVIPIIAKSDTLSAIELAAVKTSILTRLQTSSVKPFLFGTALDDALLSVQGLAVNETSPAPTDRSLTDPEPKQLPFSVPTYPYAVSSTTGPDSDTMDASLLMSPDYVQPLLPSELVALVNQVFDPESGAWLRHSAAKKFVAWRRRTRLPGDSFVLHGLQQHSLKRGSLSSTSIGLNGAPRNTSAASSIFSAASPSGVLVPRPGSPYYTSNANLNSNLQSPFPASSPSLSHAYPDTLDYPTEFSLTRLGQGEQTLNEVRLAKWATDLQRSLRNERDRYEELQRNERAKWLLERIGEEVASGNIIASPGGSPRADWAVVRHRNTKEGNYAGQRYGRAGKPDSRDPLGLCDFSDEIRRRGAVLAKVLGGVSVLGAVVVAVVRACGWEVGGQDGGRLWGWLVGAAE